MINNRNRYCLWIWVAVISLATVLSVRAFQLCNKQQMHPDEVYSVMISGCNEYFYLPVPDGDYSGAELSGKLLGHNSLTDDLQSLYTDNADAPHASLYYMLHRLFLCGIDEWSPQRIIVATGLLNLLLLGLAMLLLMQIGRKLFPGHRWAVLAMTVMAFGCQASGEAVVLLREYQLATVAVLWLVHRLLSMVIDGKYSPLSFLWLTLSVTLVLSTGYLNAYFLAGLFLFMFITAAIRHRHPDSRKLLIVLPCCGLGGLALAWAIYPGFFNFLLHENPHTRLAFANFTGTVPFLFKREIYAQFFTLPGLIFLAAIAIAPVMFKVLRGHSALPRRNIGMAAVLIVLSLVSIILVQYTSILKEARYSYPFIPLMALIVPLVLAGWKKEPAQILSFCLILYYLSCSLIHPPRKDYDWGKMRNLLKDGAVIYGVNPNEIPLIMPVLKPEARYRIISHTGTAPHYSRFDICVVRYNAESIDSTYNVTPLVGSLKLIRKKVPATE